MSDTTPGTAGYTPGQRRSVLAAMCLSLVLVVASVAMLTVAAPAISADLGASQSQQQWILDAYTLALAALLLPFGAVGDRHGRRGALLVGIGWFGMATAGCALAGSAGALIACRALAGAGAALIMPATLATITSVFPAEERPRAVGVWVGFTGARRHHRDDRGGGAPRDLLVGLDLHRRDPVRRCRLRRHHPDRAGDQER